jgi:hypothetical protein
MSYILNKVVIDGNGVMDRHYPIAVADTEDELKKYCEAVIGLPVGKPRKFTWDDYYVIEPSNLIIL